MIKHKDLEFKTVYEIIMNLVERNPSEVMDLLSLIYLEEHNIKPDTRLQAVKPLYEDLIQCIQKMSR